MATFSITIPTEHEQKAIDAVEFLMPQPATGEDENGEPTYDYTPAQWVKHGTIALYKKTWKRMKDSQDKKAVDNTPPADFAS